MKNLLVLAGIVMIFRVSPLWGDTCHYENINQVKTLITIPGGDNIHTVTLDVNTNNTSFDSSQPVYLGNSGSSYQMSWITDGDYKEDLSGTGPSNQGYHIRIWYDGGSTTPVILHLTISANRQFPPKVFQTTYTWTFTVTGFAAPPPQHDFDASTGCLDGSDNPMTDYTTLLRPVPTITVTAGGVNAHAACLALAGNSIDLSGSSTPDPAGGNVTYSWNYGGATSTTTTTAQDPPAFAAVSTDPQGYNYYPVQLAVRSDNNGAVGSTSLPLYVKQPPTANISYSVPSTGPEAYGDAPLAVKVSAVVHPNDPFTTDYTFQWTFETGSTDSTNIINAPHTYTTTGAKTVSLQITDDYGFTGAASIPVYVTPLDKINFPPATTQPFEPVVKIDGILKPTDTNGDGAIDVVETGWNNSFRATQANGTDDPVANQCLWYQKTGTETYLLLSFEVHGDSTYDNNDVIVLTFRPDKNAEVPANDRKVFIFPVWQDQGACDPGGTGGNVGAHVYNKPPQVVQYFGNSAGWTSITTGITEAAAETSPGFYTRVHSYPEGTKYAWDVEVRVPLNTATGGSSWIDIKNLDHFLFYANVIRVVDRSVSFGQAGYAVQYRWPRDAPDAFGTLNGYAFAPYTWGTATATAGLGESEGVYIEGASDVGVLNGSNITGYVTLVPDASGNATVPFIARVKNNNDAPQDVGVEFRYAHWGATLGVGGDWRTVPAPNVSTPPTDLTTEPAVHDHNPTVALRVPAATPGSPVTRDFHLDWILNQTDPEYQHFKNVQNHQCVSAEIVGGQGVNVLRKGAWRNVIFAASSTFNDTARISTVGCGLPPLAGGVHRVILEIKKREWTEPTAGQGTVPLTTTGDVPGGSAVTSYLEYIVYAYYDKGKSLTINGRDYYTFEPIASFGYTFYHRDDVRRWIDSLQGARKIRDDLYVLDIAPESQKDISLRVESLPMLGLSISLHGGVAVPVSTTASSYTLGAAAVMDVTYDLTRSLALQALLGYYGLTGKSGVSDARLLGLSLDARYRYAVRPPFSIWACAGPGWYFASLGTSHPGFNAGVGVEYQITRRISAELGSNFHMVFDPDQTKFVTGTLGVDIRF